MISIVTTEKIKRKSWIAPLQDGIVLSLSWVTAFVFRFSVISHDAPKGIVLLALNSLPICILVWLIIMFLFGVYRALWRYAGLHDVPRLISAIFVSTVAMTAISMLLIRPPFPPSITFIHLFLAAPGLLGLRLLVRMRADRISRRLWLNQARPLLLLGTIDDAVNALRTLNGSRQWTIAAIYSPNNTENDLSVHGLNVVGPPFKLADVARDLGVQHALVAGTAGSATRRLLLEQASDARLTLLVMPRTDDWMHPDAISANPRHLEIDDLLGREAVELDVKGLSELFAGRCALVTGAGGSIGAELCRQLARFGVGQLVCLDISEFAIYQLEKELRSHYPKLKMIFLTANVREANRLERLFAAYTPAVVFHAAAYKHVPLMEHENALEALRTNVLGTWNAAKAAAACNAKRFVLISTDKAVNPTNVMGASKRLAERGLQALTYQFPDTRMVSVRFGNVLGSSGSVVPLFSQQIAAGGPVTVTHPDIVRYFMTIPEAAQLVLQAGLMGENGEIYVMDMGEPVKIADLAKLMIKLSGHSEHEIPLVYTGLRPGEKLYEELLADDETSQPTSHPKLRVARQGGLDNGIVNLDFLMKEIESLNGLDGFNVRDFLRITVPEYQPAN